MSFLTPLSFLLAALAIPILVLYMLKLRRREVEVPSVLLWQMLVRDREANSPWQRLRRNLLLFLQLLLLAALVTALARPFVKVPAVAAAMVVVLLDASASMQAADVQGAPIRFEAAREVVRRLIDGLPADSRMTLILAGRQPQVLASATGDKAVLRDALGRAQVENGAANWAAAVALAAGAVRSGNLEEAALVVVSDGGLPADGLPPLPGEVRYLSVGASADNLALAALALRPAAGGPQLFANVANYGDIDRQVLLSIYIDDELFTAHQLDVPAGKSADYVITHLPESPAVYMARLSPPAAAGGAKLVDKLPLDDTAWAAYQPEFASRVLVISPGNIFLEQILSALPGLTPYRLKPGAALPAEPFDLYVYDGVIGGALPAADLLLVAPSANPLFDVGGVFTATAPVRVAAEDSLTHALDWSNVHVLQARRVTLPSWARVLVQAPGGPLVFVGETGGRRAAVLTFDLHDSDLPLQVAYPILMANLIEYLAPGRAFSAPDGLRPGETLTIYPPGGDTAIAIYDPDEVSYTARATEGGVLFVDTHKLGVYTVVSNRAVLGSFAVNLFEPAESNIRPAPAIHLGRGEVSAATRSQSGQLEIWPWLAGAALALLVIEWWAYHRSSTLPAAGWRGLFTRRGGAGG